MKTQIMAKIKSHWKQLVFELSEYIFDALTFACPVLAKLCSMASSVESSIFSWSTPQQQNKENKLRPAKPWKQIYDRTNMESSLVPRGWW